MVLIPKVMCSITYIYGIKKHDVSYSDYFLFLVSTTPVPCLPYHGCVNFLDKVFQKVSLSYIQSLLPINIDGIEPGMKKMYKNENLHIICFFFSISYANLF
jgi:hypothetical protein